ncbi:MAG TPA: DNA-binding protein WhiA [Clostridiales bacterium]|nr:DNA-binding protein WhiA [Clostridiales bacterium]
MNFSEEVKNEILGNVPLSLTEERAILSAFIRTAGVLTFKGGVAGFEFSTESERAAEFFTETAKELYGLTPDNGKPQKKGRKTISFTCEGSGEALADMGIIRRQGDGYDVDISIDSDLFPTDAEKIAFVKGAFAGGGSVTLPSVEKTTSTGYHLEFVFTNYRAATDFCEILSELYFLPKLAARKESFIAYMKTRDEIADLLSAMGAERAAGKLAEVSIEKEINNNSNRQINCEVSNMSKQIDASVKQICAINRIAETVGLDALPAPIKETAEARVKYKDDTLSKLAERLGITKSCLNHRLRKIVEIGGSL